MTTFYSDREAFEQFKQIHPELATAGQIAAIEEEIFVQTYAADLSDGVRTARRIHHFATQVSEHAILLWASLKDMASPYWQQTRFNNIPLEFIAHQQGIPGYDRLFGSLAYATCDHARSIFGPAAYFVDLLRFVQKYMPDQTSDPKLSLFSLLTRRPDLARIKLDRANAYELVPSIDIINEVLTTIVAKTDQPNAEVCLAEAHFPMNLPTNLPLEEARAYLKQFKLTLQQFYQAIGQLWALSAHRGEAEHEQEAEKAREQHLTRQIAEELNLSPQIFHLINNSQPTSASLSALYDWELTNQGDKGLETVANFLAQTGLRRDELETLFYQDLDSNELNAGLAHRF